MAKKVVANHIVFDSVVEAIARGEMVTIPTKGNSMLPFIVGERDSVTLEGVDELHVGDILLARLSDKRYVLHRAIEIADDCITLMGDGNIKGVERVKPCEIIAKAITIHYKGRQIDCNSTKQRKRAQLWRELLPIRRYILAIYARAIGIR